MDVRKKIAAALLSCSMVLTSAFASGTVLAEDVETTTSVSVSGEYIPSDTEDTSAETSVAEETTTIGEPLATTTTMPEYIGSDDPISTVSEPQFNVFDIYDAYQEMMSNTEPTAQPTTQEPTQFPVIDAKNGIKGIDVSKWQSTVDWDKVANTDVNYAIIRAGYGKLKSQKDPTFDTNMKNAEKAGVKRGIYWYSYATTVEEAYQEAEACYSVIKNYKFEYPVVFDIEDPTQVKLSTATVSAICDAFCSRMESKGYYVSIYSYASFLNTKIYSNVLDKYDVFVAHFNVDTPGINHSYGMWQYSSTGRINGITTDVDLSYAYLDYPNIIAKAHKNGY